MCLSKDKLGKHSVGYWQCSIMYHEIWTNLWQYKGYIFSSKYDTITSADVSEDVTEHEMSVQENASTVAHWGWIWM